MAAKKLRPLGDKIVLRPSKEEEKTKSGIVLPATASKEKPEQGEVVAVGPGRLNDEGKVVPMSVKVGDTVVFQKYGPTEVDVEGEELLVVAESDILAIVE
ncbi:MAG: co-chaperone GroES [Candidatus Andersenbacteria bacterium]